jgi:uncharacterized membrane protein
VVDTPSTETSVAARRDPVRWVLGVTVAVWAATFLWLGWARHARFGTFGFDLGIYDQGVWLLSRFEEPFVTVKGLNLFGHHMNPIVVVLVPFYWLGAGPEFLLVVQVAAQAAGALAVFLLARDRLAGERWLAVVLAGVLLVNPTYQYLAWEYFHPDTLAIPAVLFAYWAARAGRWRWYGLAAVAAVACKEDAALAVTGLGLLVAVRNHRRIGLATAAASAAWFVLSTRLLMPRALGGLPPFYEQYFPDFGRTGGEIARGILTKPRRVLELATRSDRVAYYRMMFAPVGLLALGDWPALVLVAGPMLAVNILTSDFHTRDYRFHYSALVLAGIIIATVEAVALLGRNAGVRRFLVGGLAVVSFGTSVAWGPSPFGVRYRTGIWGVAGDPRTDFKRSALAVIPPAVAVSAGFDFTPHLTHRREIYEFPQPWVAVTWGVRGEGLPDPNRVRWLVLDTRRFLMDQDRTLAEVLLADQFAVRYEQDGIVAAERVKPG